MLTPISTRNPGSVNQVESDQEDTQNRHTSHHMYLFLWKEAFTHLRTLMYIYMQKQNIFCEIIISIEYNYARIYLLPKILGNILFLFFCSKYHKDYIEILMNITIKNFKWNYWWILERKTFLIKKEKKLVCKFI